MTGDNRWNTQTYKHIEHLLLTCVMSAIVLLLYRMNKKVKLRNSIQTISVLDIANQPCKGFGKKPV